MKVESKKLNRSRAVFARGAPRSNPSVDYDDGFNTFSDAIQIYIIFQNYEIFIV